ncbi:MAG: Transcription initiation factor TFIID subunit 5 [Chrysothrix sp. TS-e1954]|nr:MAG: Transcription initiation factor TFIID subunit 5 [Chrysothrix sp. TS-e1954]
MDSRSGSNGPPSAGIPGPPPQQTSTVQPTQNLNQIVVEYLNKKGYSRTEAILRQESANVDAQGKVIHDRAESRGGRKYFDGYIFVYSFLGLVQAQFAEFAKQFFDDYSPAFSRNHEAELRSLAYCLEDHHVESNTTMKLYRDNKYRLTLTQTAYFTLIQFCEQREREGGSVVVHILQQCMHIVTVDRSAAGAERAFVTMLARAEGDYNVPDEDEGIPGHKPGSANTAPDAPSVLTKLALGMPALDTDLTADIRDELEDHDALKPPEPGQNSLIDEFEQKIKREPNDDAPNRDNVPLPAPMARDVAMEVQKIKELRGRLRIDPKASGIGPGVSVTMFTFHNTFDSVNCIDFSGDNMLVAAGTAESYIRVWSLEGKPLPSLSTNRTDKASVPSASRRLVGHSGPVYAVSFSPSIANNESASPSTSSRYLLSASADKSVRLWSLDAWSCLVAYKGHDRPVWDVTWGPFGHYFLTGSHDNTARLWSTDCVSPLRIFAGHDQDVDCVAFHPNNAYVFTGSTDRTVRMWDVNRGSAVRMFTGHTASITAIACAPSGKTLASADDAGTVILWDLATGRLAKRMRGHSKGGIWSMSWSVESSLLVSSGADCTVRVWDVLQQTDGSGAAKTADGAAGKNDGAVVNSGVSGVPGKKAKARDAAVTADQISAFPTKKSPVYKVRFTNMNLVLAGGCYLP